MAERITRRRFLKPAAIAWGAAACSAPTRTPSPLPDSVRPTSSVTAPPTSPGPTGTPAPTARPAPSPAPDKIIITSNADFYQQSYSTAPEADPAMWALRVDGLVQKPLTLTLDEIRNLPSVEIMRTVECIGNPVGGPLIGNAVWKGTYLKPLYVKIVASVFP